MTRSACTGMLTLALTLLAQVRAADDFPPPRDTETNPVSIMPADQAAASFRAADGFRVGVFAAEPDVRNPIAMAWDARGRLWVAENYTYAERTQRFDLRQRDRVLIFEDADGDGRFDRRKVFTDEVQMLTSVELGRGGAWLLCPPRLLFVPDKNGDDVPDAAPEVVLDGFDVPAENYHNFANGLRWGPDGWLYGRCGASAPGRIGAPGTPDDRRVPLNGGLWRYHPESKHFEVIAHGTTNPWGHDWDALGEAFFINTVNGHLWHAIPGAHFVRPHTIDPNPRAYLAIDQHADHFHWDTAKDWSDSRDVSGEHGRLGGGHAHSGLMIYQADQWPAEDRGKLFTLNFHGRRMNVERLEHSGAGLVGRHEPDRLFAADPMFRGIDLSYGPDGGVYVLDWSDVGECHDNTGVVRTSGRIFKITRGSPGRVEVGDLSRLDGPALVGLHRHPNEWFARMARLQLADRHARGDRMIGVAEPLRAMVAHEKSPALRLRALWTLHAVGSDDEALLRSLLGDEHESIRAWAIRLLTDAMPIDTIASRRVAADVPPSPEILADLARMAREDRSGLVRLTLASTLQRLPVPRRAELAAPLLARGEDAGDHNLPLLLWYGLIPVADADPSALARLASGCRLPTTRRLMARRLAEDTESNPAPLDALLAAATSSDSSAYQADILQGVSDGLRGWRKARRPSAWDALASRLGASEEAAVRDRVRDLSVLFGDGRALGEVERLAMDGKADLETRRTALRTLIEARPPGLRATCEKLLGVRFLNATALRGLVLFDDPAIGRSLAKSYRSFHPSERPSVLDALCSRPAFASAMLDQVAAGAIARADITPFQARQVRGMGDPALQKKLAEVWGEQRESAADKRAAIAARKARLTPEALAGADPGRGRALFNQACAACHTLHGHGGDIGPDLTGSGRDNLDYLLENIVDPGATVNADFRMSVAATKDGRVLNGLVRDRTDRTVTLRTLNESLVLERAEIESLETSPVSFMPEGLLETLSEDQARDLIAYLMHRAQVPLPEAKR